MEVRNCKRLGKGKGLYSLKEHNIGDIIHILSGEILGSPTKLTIHIGNNKQILDNFGIYINHSDQTNIKFDGLAVIAIKKINIDDEIVFDYNENEINMAEPFYYNGDYICGIKYKN